MNMERVLLTDEDLKARGFGGWEPLIILARRIALAQVVKIKRLGLVIVAENQGKPTLHSPGLEKTNEQYQRGFQDGYDMGQNSMVSADFRRVEEIA